MSFEAGLFQLLSTAPALVALQGARVYPVVLPESSTLPATTYQVVGGAQKSTFRSSGPQRRRVQLDFFADYQQGTYDQVIALRDATKLLLNGFVGELPNGFYVTSCLFHQPIDYFNNDARQYRHASEFYFTFNL
jgi:hypothetical protein